MMLMTQQDNEHYQGAMRLICCIKSFRQHGPLLDYEPARVCSWGMLQKLDSYEYVSCLPFSDAETFRHTRACATASDTLNRHTQKYTSQWCWVHQHYVYCTLYVVHVCCTYCKTSSESDSSSLLLLLSPFAPRPPSSSMHTRKAIS